MVKITITHKGGADMTYKQLLIHRYRFAHEHDIDAGPLDYLAFRNLEALRAWRKRRWAQPGRAPAAHHSAWLKPSWRSLFPAS
jgi:hypothetical protein